MISEDFFRRDPVACARDLVGTLLIHGKCRGVVIETEAYAEIGDQACHLFTRPSARRFANEHAPGTAYVYLNYGIHWLANVLTHDPATGASGFVLLRALDPVSGLAEMERRRGQTNRRALCSGPGKLARALGIGRHHHGRSLCQEETFCFIAGGEGPPDIAADRRVGISTAQELEWRFLIRDHPGVSVKFGKA